MSMDPAAQYIIMIPLAVIGGLLVLGCAGGLLIIACREAAQRWRDRKYRRHITWP